MAVVKGNSYGHGSQQIFKALDSHVDAFAVATLEEAIELRESGCKKPVCLLSGFFAEDQIRVLSQLEIDAVIYCDEQLIKLEQSNLPKRLGVWLKINTGMNRLGVPVRSVASRIRRIQSCRFVHLKGIMSHFAIADELESSFTCHQIERFLACTKNYEAPLSLANSAGILRWPKSHLDWVRPGIMLYGASPFENIAAKELNLKPVMSLYSTIIAVNRLQPNKAVGYGLTWVSSALTRVGIVACGYADGYLRNSSPGGKVLIGKNRAKLIGRVSMDSFAIDLTDYPEVDVGAKVQLFGKGLPVENLAKIAGTIPYEILTSFGARNVDKRYI